MCVSVRGWEGDVGKKRERVRKRVRERERERERGTFPQNFFGRIGVNVILTRNQQKQDFFCLKESIFASIRKQVRQNCVIFKNPESTIKLFTALVKSVS